MLTFDRLDLLGQYAHTCSHENVAIFSPSDVLLLCDNTNVVSLIGWSSGDRCVLAKSMESKNDNA